MASRKSKSSASKESFPDFRSDDCMEGDLPPQQNFLFHRLTRQYYKLPNQFLGHNIIMALFMLRRWLCLN
ncbi:hypothetical protein QTP88_024921 [Uroleucon formosanum]